MSKTNYFILYIISCVGFVGYLFQETRQIMLTLTPLALLIINLVILISFLGDIKLLFWSIIVFLFTFIFEVIGVRTKLIFGDLMYGKILGFKLLDIPLIVAFNWTLIIISTLKIARFITKDNFGSAIIASIIVVILDFFLESASIKLGYWSWKDGVIPFHNYFVWFLYSLLISLMLNKLKVRIEPAITVHFFVLQLIFLITFSFYSI
ncbi:MAG: carotenoid biosynthesis protein [Ignavibacteria bacterium]|nr:carotenoid biosynthesis protein [Ignavibacteria bacterium]